MCEYARAIATREGLSDGDTLALMYSALLHDTGKADTSRVEGGHITSHGHEQAGVGRAQSFLDRLMDNGEKGTALLNSVSPLVGNHLSHLNISNARSVRRLAKRIEPASIEMLSWLIEADQSGRPPLPGGMPQSAKDMVRISEESGVLTHAPQAFLMGRHLINLGMTPGREMGELIRASYEAQLDGDITDTTSALTWAKERLS